MKWGTPLKVIKEDIIGTENTFHAWCLLVAVVLIISMGLYLNSPAISFHGVAGSRESNLNFEHPVEIKRVLVIPGQKVKRGDLLVELNQFELDNSIRLLMAKIRKLKAEAYMREQMNHVVGNALKLGELDPLTVEIRDQQDELEFLERQRNNLFVFADIDGIVGSVNFRKGETVPAFQSIVTIAPESPSYVQGFIYEKLRSGVKIGSVVQITSSTNESLSVTGRVVSIGSRFIQIPPRIAQETGPALWGREVIVEIPQVSGLLLNERVTIAPQSTWLPNFIAHADFKADNDQPSPDSPTPIRMPFDLKGRSMVEATGAVYLKDVQKFLVASKVTDAINSPILYLVGTDGEVDKKTLHIPELATLQGAEALSVEGNAVYLLTSNRTIGNTGRAVIHSNLLRMQRRGVDLFDTKSLDLRALLRRELLRSKITELAAMGRGPEAFEIDSFVIHHDVLYIGLRKDNTALIVKLHALDDLFETQQVLKTELWKNLDVADGSKLRGFTFIGEKLYYLTSSSTGGTLWSLNDADSATVKIRSFEHDSPQGLAYDEIRAQLFVTFSTGREGSKYLALSSFGPGSN